MRIRPILNRLALFLLGAVFFAAGLVKIIDPEGFARALAGYRLLPEGAVPLVAALLPWGEAVAGGLVIAGPLRRGALGVLLGLSGLFVVVGFVTLARGLTPVCGCFGSFSGRFGVPTLLMDISLFLLAAVLLKTEFASPPQAERS